MNIKTHITYNQSNPIYRKCTYQNIENVGKNQDIKFSSITLLFVNMIDGY